MYIKQTYYGFGVFNNGKLIYEVESENEAYNILMDLKGQTL